MPTYEIWLLLIQGLLLVTTIVGVIIAYRKATEYIQDRADRFQSEVKWRTEKAYENYRISETLTKSTSSIFERSKKGTDYTEIKVLDHDIAMVINYLESMAVGIKQKIYNEEMLKDFIKESVYKSVKVFILGEDGEINGRSWKSGPSIIKAKEQPHLVDLYNKWYPQENTIHFRNEKK